MSYREYKCPKCGWVHAAISLSDAAAQVATANEYSKFKCKLQTASMDDYWHCFKCGAPTDGCVLAGLNDAPSGCTIQGVVVPGVVL